MLKIIIGSDKEGFQLKEHLKYHLQKLGWEVIDKTPTKDLDFVESSKCVAQAILSKEGDKGILIDQYGSGSFMVANKHKGIICAQLADEHSAKMTRDHNNTSIITIGSGITGPKLAERIVEAFINSEYSGGRHQIRVDMLNRMC